MNFHSFNPVAAVLLIPICSAALLAILPGYRITARLNVVASLLTFLSALSLFVIERPQPTPYVLVDDLNIVFIVLNTFVGFTTSIFSASYIAHELDTGRLTPTYLRFYHAMYQTMMFGMNLAFVSNNIGLMWVAVEIATLTHGADGRYLSHARRAGSGVEVFHPGQRRDRVRPVRYHPGLHGGASGRGRGPGCHGLDAAGRACGAFRPCPSQCRFRLPVSRIRDEGRPRPAACLAARRARRRSDPDIGRIVRPAAECRALCAACASRYCSPSVRTRLLPAR